MSAAPPDHEPDEPVAPVDPAEPPAPSEAPGPRLGLGWLPIVFALLLVAMSVYAALDWFAQLPRE